jgi:hypothetical protein
MMRSYGLFMRFVVVLESSVAKGCSASSARTTNAIQISLQKLEEAGFEMGAAKVVSNPRFYHRRAAEERMRAARALTPAARAWHQSLADDFARRAVEGEPRPLVTVSA